MSSYVYEKQSRGVGAIGAIDLGAPARASGTIVNSRGQTISAMKRPAVSLGGRMRRPSAPRRLTAPLRRSAAPQLGRRLVTGERVPAKRLGVPIDVLSRFSTQPSSASAVEPMQVTQAYPVGPSGGGGLTRAVTASQQVIDQFAEDDMNDAALQVPTGSNKTLLIVGGLGAVAVLWYLLKGRKS